MQAELIRQSLPPDDKERKFEASNCYFQNFMSRQNISLQVPCICSKKTRLTPEQFVRVTGQYLQDVQDVVARFNLSSAQILNCDETSVCKMMCLPKFLGYINNKAQTGTAALKTVSIDTDYSRDNYTLMLTATGDGRLIKPFIIFKKADTLPLADKTFFDQLNQLPVDDPDAVCAFSNNSGWMTYQAMLLYLKNVILPYIKVHGDICLTLDNCSSHNINKILQNHYEQYLIWCQLTGQRDLNAEEFLTIISQQCHVVYVPKNTTPQNQVFDVSVNGPFKAYLRGIHHNYCLEQHRLIQYKDAPLGIIVPDQKVKIPKPNRQLCWEHVKKAISMIKPSVIIHGFEKTQLIRSNTTQEPLRLYVLSDAERIMGFAQTTINKRQWQEQQQQEVNRTLFPMDYSDSEDEQMLQQDVDYQYFGAE
ncbi:Conserved_hypothetical protein [Hexamita inflata]|uniref:DDE-1 domain-containing protein n=1 Tax=Hexamita inflata TaxID=28002 RepID=A0AA86Q562_9EUKA|nr:Conserved hypothetical protein [Hexamita inflata]